MTVEKARRPRVKIASVMARARERALPSDALTSAGSARPFDGEAAEVVQSWRAIDIARTEEDQDWLGFLAFAIARAPSSEAQLVQDLWALWETDSKVGGYFAEFGACDGKWLSNTYLLEKHFGWSGIAAEPNPIYHEELAQNRACLIDHRCVWTRSGETVPFRSVDDPEFSRMGAIDPGDVHEAQGRRSKFECIDVETVSLSDLLSEAGAPPEVDFLSLDTEGSEFDILDAFDFDRFNIRLICVEHNFGPRREQVRALLEKHGYRQRFAGKTRWDDWFIRN